VSRQLGHADVSVTARHCARWADGDAYCRPLEVAEDEVPADLLSRLAAKRHKVPTARRKLEKRKRPEPQWFRALELVAGGRYARDSLPVPLMLPVVGRVAVGAIAG